MHSKLLHLIAENVHLDKADEVFVEKLFLPVSCEKNTMLEREGKIPQYLYFINSGFVRVFYWEDGKQITTHINCPPGFITSFNSFISGTIATDNVECVTGCELLQITKTDLEWLYKRSAQWAAFGKIIYERSLTYNEERTKEMIGLSAEQRYLKLLRSQPEIVQQVPLQYISSYLGIEPQSLSRIRKKISS
ncbi:cAMP-binding domain of CRP or a regulatory subunit of cAMP-dependent protein kinases [Chitinophaga sp. CF118]|uniref:Crp/Fnr family transcriptional regulator n=1 Tax=Chitinophaga sp. CF118 TaxID=1884367 RepID=UPI0008F3A7D9|nr:Crp/Fnr family transcriptional regulator [Chitinophaga sp. CF118]SFD99625.1 cAMP-binding domain of CRP or a regulatory subunit of cAMP-dependent protein kinases [Chitinophaga sp. CF118]